MADMTWSTTQIMHGRRYTKSIDYILLILWSPYCSSSDGAPADLGSFPGEHRVFCFARILGDPKPLALSVPAIRIIGVTISSWWHYIQEYFQEEQNTTFHTVCSVLRGWLSKHIREESGLMIWPNARLAIAMATLRILNSNHLVLPSARRFTRWNINKRHPCG